MEPIKTTTEVPKKQQRITHQSKQLTTRKALDQYNTQADDHSTSTVEQGHRQQTNRAMHTEEREEIQNEENRKQVSTYPNEQWTA